jgi:O-antigen/teichoic acid export membrane protein
MLRIVHIPPSQLKGSVAIQSALGFCDQATVALSSFFPILLLGRLAGPTELGVFSLSLSVGIVFILILEALTLSSYPLLRARAPFLSEVFTFYALFCCVAGQFGLLLLAYFLKNTSCGDEQVYSSVCSAIALIPYLPPVVLRYLLRSLSLYRGDLLSIFFLDFTLLLGQTGSLLLVAAFDTVNAEKVFWVLAISNSVFALVWFVHYRKQVRFRLRGLAQYLVKCVALGRWALVSELLFAMPFYVFPWMLVLFRSASETAVFAAANTIVGIISHAFGGLTKSLPVRLSEAFARGGKTALDLALRRSFRVVLPATGIIVAVVFLSALPLAKVIFPDHAHYVAGVVRTLSLAALAVTVHMILSKGYWAMARPECAFIGDIVRGICALGLGALLGNYGGANGCAMALLVASIAGSVTLFIKYYATYSIADR